MRLNGKVVVIAGGFGALGQTVAPAVARAGATVITADRNPLPAQVVAGSAMKADVTDCLIGHLFTRNYDELFGAMRDFASIPEPVAHGAPLLESGELVGQRHRL